MKSLLNDNNSTYDQFKWTQNVTVVSNLNFTNPRLFFKSDLLNIRQLLQENHPWEELDFDEEIYYYGIKQHGIKPWTNILEWERIQEYTAIWKKNYIWFFFIWIKIDDEMAGIS